MNKVAAFGAIIFSAIIGSALLAASVVPTSLIAQNYQRVTEASMTPAPRNSNNNNMGITLNGQEAVPYAYGYSFSMPSDSKWRFIAERCINSADGNTCISGHWIRRIPGRCEEVTSHTIRRGNYIQIVQAGPVATCRN